MRYPKAIPFVGLLMVCFMFAARSAKANDITFHDIAATNAVTVTETNPGRLLQLFGCGGAGLDVCGVALGGGGISVFLLSTTFSPQFTYLIGETSLTSGSESDDLDSLSPFVIGVPAVSFKFLS